MTITMVSNRHYRHCGLPWSKPCSLKVEGHLELHCHIVTDNASNMITAFNFDLPGFTGGEDNNSDDDTDSESDEDDALDQHL